MQDHLGNTPLHLAAAGGHAAAIEAIVPFGPDVNAANNLGDTPLHKVRIIIIVLQPLHSLSFISKAASRNHIAATRALVKAGANPEKANNDGKRPRDLTRNGDVIAYLSPADEVDSDEDDKKKKKKKDSDSE